MSATSPAQIQAHRAWARAPQLSDDAEVNRAVVVAIVLAAACGSKKAAEPPPEPVKETPKPGSAAGSGSSAGSAAPVTAAELHWTSPTGEPMLALAANGTLEGPCGPIGGVTANDVVIDGQKFSWTGVDRKGRKYQIAPLPWTIEVGDAGDISLVNPGKPVVPLGKVTGTATEEGARWFAALVIAAPALQIKLGLATTDGKVTYALSASADMDAWTIKAGTTVIAKKLRDQTHGAIASDAAEGLAPSAITVTSSAPRAYDVKITGTQTAYGAAAYSVTEAEDGALRWKPDDAKAALPLGALTGRAACKAHDKAAAALIETLLSTKSGWTSTRDADQKWFGKK
jgi:hypothetical protein